MAPALVQSAKATSIASGTTVNKAFASNVTAGNRIFVYADSGSANSADVNAPTGSSLTFTKLNSLNVGGSGGVWFSIWTAVVASTAALTVTVTQNVNGELSFTMEEWSGLDSSAGSGCLDVSATGSANNTVTTNCSSGTTAATHASGQLALIAVADWGAGLTWTLSTANGFTKNSAASLDADANAGIAVANKISSSGTTEGAAVWTTGGSSDTDVGWVVVIKAAAGAATGIPDVTMAQIG